MPISSTSTGQPHTLDVYGDFACFSRPEAKVERFSYPLPTPSAARGIFESIYYKPEFRWHVRRIEMVNPPIYIALRRNEVKDKASDRAISGWMKGTAEPEPLLADLTGEEAKGRTQRQTMALKSPRFRITAVIESKSDQPVRTFDEQFVRRASQGKCFYQPSFGCREFAAFFRLVTDLDAERNARPTFPWTQDLGFMLFDVWDLDATGATRAEQEATDKKRRRDNTPSVSLFKAKVVAGVLDVPSYGSAEVLKTGGVL